jgi:hypothetical protein
MSQPTPNAPSERTQIVIKILTLRAQLEEIEAAEEFLGQRREDVAEAMAIMEGRLESIDTRAAAENKS